MIINKGRRTGKTHDLIIVSHYTGSPIIVDTLGMKESVMSQAKDMGYDIPVFTIKEWRKNIEWSYFKNIPVLIDEAGLTVERALEEYLGTKILAATITLPMEEAKNDIS